jgi:hypothetical protein
MARRKKHKNDNKNYRPKHADKFLELLKADRSAVKKAREQNYNIAGFRTKNINMLWHWNTLEDVKF